MGDLALGADVIQKITSQNLASGALNYTSNFATDFRLGYVSFRFTGEASQTITVSIKSVQGTNYNTVIYSENFKSITDFIYTPDSPLAMMKGDEIIVTCTNTGTPSVTVYVVVSVWQE